MTEYRVTYPDRYPQGSVGRENPEARQGYYVLACSVSHAILACVEGGRAAVGEIAHVERFGLCRLPGIPCACACCGGDR